MAYCLETWLNFNSDMFFLMKGREQGGGWSGGNNVRVGGWGELYIAIVLF